MSRTPVRALVLALALASPASANHPVFVEGNNAADGAPGTTMVTSGTAGDYDGDGRVGTAEDTDNATDRTFGTLTAALLSVNGGANANGHVIIVTSGRFGEALRIPNTDAGQAVVNGVTLIEAAPGVQAQIDAVIAGDAGNATRQGGPGIVIATPSTDRIVVLRNLVVRNFSVGLHISGNSRVTLDNVRFDSNVTANVWVEGSASLTANGCALQGGGMRFNPAMSAPSPGYGIAFSGLARGSLSGCTISGNVATGVANFGSGLVRVVGGNVFDNGLDFDGKIRRK